MWFNDTKHYFSIYLWVVATFYNTIFLHLPLVLLTTDCLITSFIFCKSGSDLWLQLLSIHHDLPHWYDLLWLQIVTDEPSQGQILGLETWNGWLGTWLWWILYVSNGVTPVLYWATKIQWNRVITVIFLQNKQLLTSSRNVDNDWWWIDPENLVEIPVCI